ncbi:MAG: thiamine-phosphate kinase [Pseudomonadota bacterium]
MSGELDLIAALTPLFRRPHPAVRTGIGDDCAVLEVDGATLLLTIDTFIEGIHFRREFAPPRVLGSKAAAAAISDIAAMGGEATALLVSAALGPDWSVDDARAIAAGIDERAAAAGAAVIGGDTATSPGPLFLDIAVLGRIPPGGRAVQRDGARPGDLVAVTGTPGESALGLRHLLGTLLLTPAEQARAVTRHLDPTPRLREGRILASFEGVHAMIDVSDGLARDIGHLARAAGLLAVIEPHDLPCGSAMDSLRARAPEAWRAAALGGGEDYELAVALDPAAAARIMTRLEEATGTRITVVGRFGEPGTGAPGVRLEDGTRIDELGFEHPLQDSPE